MWRWRRKSRPLLLEVVAANAAGAAGAELHVLRNTRAIEEYLARVIGSD
jgi:hypothetical protein